MKLEQRRQLERRIGKGGTVLEVYAGKGNLSSRLYARKGRRLILVDNDAESLQQAHRKLKGKALHETIAMDNVKWISEEMQLEALRDLRLVDFDAFGSPADPAKAFFDRYPVNQPLVVAFTDGSALHNRYIQDEEGKRWLRETYGVSRIPASTRTGVISTLDKFMENEGRDHGFKAHKVSVAHGDANTVYVGYKLTATRHNEPFKVKEAPKEQLGD